MKGASVKLKKSAKNTEDDRRFDKISSDPLFKEMRRKDRKVVIDERFQQMFKDDRFKVGNSKVDKRGRKFDLSSNDHLSNLYDLEQSDVDEGDSLKKEVSKSESESSSEEEDEEQREIAIKLDLARGEGNVSSSSSSDESSAEEEDEVEEERNVALDSWGEMDRSVKRVEWASRRIAVCNLEWDRLSAEDLLVVLNSFKPPAGHIQSVSIYLSDFGAQRIEEEEANGPKLSEVDGDRMTEAAIRAYQLERLRYYYAVCECDSEETATTIYENCDGVEYEMSGVRFDVRFIPAEMEFDESRLKEKVDSNGMNVEDYKPKHFESFALSNVKARLTWDENNPERARSINGAFREDANLAAYQKLIAPASDSEDDEETNKKRLELLLQSDEKCVSDEEKKEDLRVDWDIPESVVKVNKNDQSADNLSDAGVESGDLAANNDKSGKKLTPFQQYLEKRKQKRRERKMQQLEKKQLRKQEIEELTESNKKKSSKRRRPENPENSTMDMGDERFSALFTDSAFAIDKTHSLFKGGELANRQALEKSAKRRRASELNSTPATNEPSRAATDKRTDLVAVAELEGDGMNESTNLIVERIKRKMGSTKRH